MKYSKTFRILALAAILSLLVTIAMPATPALAQSISLSPASGFWGTKVTVTGTGFQSSSTVYLYFGDNRIKSITVSGAGDFTTDFNVPSYATPGQSHPVAIQDEGGAKLAEAQFIIGAKIDLDLTEGTIGTLIQMSGRYFEADEKVKLYFSSNKADIGGNIDDVVTGYEYIGGATINTGGYFADPLSFSIPSALTDGEGTIAVSDGDYYIYAIYSSVGKRIMAAVKFVVIPRTVATPITLSPTSAFVGTEVTVTGTGFYNNSILYLYFDDNRIKSIAVSESGNFTTDFYVPSYTTPGTSYSVAIQDEGGTKLAEAQFTVAGNKIYLDPEEHKVSKWININGRYFEADEEVKLYFSSNEVDIGDNIDDEVTAYKYIGEATINTDGFFTTSVSFSIPHTLSDGEDTVDVYAGDYYIYVIYSSGSSSGSGITALAKFVVLGGRIELSLQEGPVSSEVEISGEGFDGSQKITIEYNGDYIEKVSGDGETDSDGVFTCTIIIPESVAGDHGIIVTDESGNKHKVMFSVKPKISIAPTLASAGDTTIVSGTGFEAPYYASDHITITVDSNEIITTPALIRTNSSGSFNGSFIVPFDSSYVDGSIILVEVRDESLNTAAANLTISIAGAIPTGPASPASISLSSNTSPDSPGHVGMELTADGTGFRAKATVTITYDNNGAFTVAIATTDDNGNFSATFSIPPSPAGSHNMAYTDRTNSVTSIFTMESEAPPSPTSLLSEVVTTAEAKVYFDWQDVDDPSGVTYIFQVASGPAFTTTLLEKKGLTNSEYTITREVNFKEKTYYYWRLKAVDGASNESEWTAPKLLQVEGFQASKPERDINIWAIGIFAGIGVIVLLLTLAYFTGRK